MTNLLEKTRQINQLLQQKDIFDLQAEFPYSKMASTLSEVLLSNAYIISNEGFLLGYNEKHNINNERVRHMVKEGQFPQSYINASNQLIKTEANISIDSDLTIFPVELRSKYPFGLTTIIPVYCAGERLGLIILARMDTSFDENDLVLAEYSTTVVGMQILYQKSRSIEAEVRGATAVQMAINTLSYSELIAVRAIFKALEGDEGRLTTSSIADEIGITRSVIVNALRKLESAGIIESRSLGMKGTYLRILNPQFTKELEKNNH